MASAAEQSNTVCAFPTTRKRAYPNPIVVGELPSNVSRLRPKWPQPRQQAAAEAQQPISTRDAVMTALAVAVFSGCEGEAAHRVASEVMSQLAKRDGLTPDVIGAMAVLDTARVEARKLPVEPPATLRSQLEAAVEQAIATLDAMDGDADLEEDDPPEDGRDAEPDDHHVVATYCGGDIDQTQPGFY